MLPGKKYTPEGVVRLLLKRKWMVILPFVAGLALSIFAASRLSERYRSETLIMVMPQRISTEILPQMVNDQIEQRLPSISDQILSRSRLERIITEYDLYAAERARGAIMEDVVQQMRTKDIKVGIEGRQSFRVSYESYDATLAHKVTARLASLYIEENQRDKDNLAQNTSAFLESELQATEAKLRDAENRLAEYKKRYAGQLPTQAEANQQAIQSAQMQLQAVSATINRARERRLIVQQQLADAQNAPVPAVPVPENVPGSAATQLSAAQQLEVAEAALAAARRKYTPSHPDVRAMERAIVDLRAKAEAEAGQPEVKPTRPVSAAELARQRRIRDLEGEIAIIDQQIESSEREERNLKSTISSYEALLAGVPTREAELVQLNRDYTTLDASYKELLKKKEASDLAANVARRQIGETFDVIDPASIPQRPFNQMQRLQIILGGAVGGLVLGLGFVGLQEFRDSSFKSEEDVTRVLQLPVLALVPVMGPPDKPGRRWMRPRS